MGRILNGHLMGELSKLTNVPVESSPLRDIEPGSDMAAAMEGISSEKPLFIRTLDRNRIAGYAALRDINGETALLLKIELPREIHAQGRKSIFYLAISVGLIGTVFIFLIIVILERSIISRITRLSRHAKEIAQKGELNRRISMGGNDEITTLSDNINIMLDSVGRSQAFLQIVVDALPDPTMVIDREFCIKLANKAVRDQFGGDPVTACLKCHQVSHHTDIPCASKEDPCPIKFVLERKQPITIEHTHFNKEGKPIHVELTAAPVFDDNGEVVQIIESSHDITERKRAEQMLKDSEEKYRILYDSSQDAIMTLAPPDWMFTSGNPATIKLFGAKNEAEFVSKGPWEVSPEHQPDGTPSSAKAKEMIEKAMKVGFNFFEWTHKRLSGEDFSATVLLTRVRSKDKEFLQATVRDVSNLKRAEQEILESEERFKAITTSAGDAIIILDNNGKCAYWNNAAERIFGYSKEEILGWDLHMMLAPKELYPEYQKHFPSWQKSGEGSAVGKTIELPALRKDGARLDMELSLSSVKIRGKWNAIGIMRDITARKESERKLKKAYDDIVRISAVKSEFTSMVSHELRTPLTSIQEAISIVLEGIDGPTTEAQNETLGVAKKNIDRLANLINNVLDFSKLESGKIEMRFREANLADLLTEIHKMMKPSADKKKIGFALALPAEPIAAVCDPDRLKQVVINIVNNAIRFTGEGGRIEIGVARLNEDTVIEVRDTGIGIKEEDMAKIFEPFGQVYHEGLWKTGGSGLGLAICRQIMEQHHGSISAESVYGKGSSFFVTIPPGLPKGP